MGGRALLQWQGTLRQFLDDVPQRRGIKDPRGFAERAQGNMPDAQAALHLLQVASLLQAAQAGDDRAKKVQQQQDGVLIKEHQPVTGFIACRAHLMQTFQQRPKHLKILNAAHVG